MADWADIYQDPERKDKLRNRILIYKDIPDAKADTKDLETGLESEVARAVQHVSICSGGHEEAWKATIDSLNLACKYVGRRLHLLIQGIPHRKELYFQRRVFVKRDKPHESKTPALSTMQDPEGKYLHVQDHWNIVRPLAIADLTDAGKVLPMDSILLTDGDFVDVGAELDFVLSRECHKGTTLKCFLTCTHIVQIIPASYVQKMKLDESLPNRKHTITPPPQERGVKKTHTTLIFDDE
ncbi:hypothetical protein F4604DRAFT_1922777 [Suillus subluteus]|nr:hypothetical protein F4604DRAFT_1922777 [Suillus subluteus]